MIPSPKDDRVNDERRWAALMASAQSGDEACYRQLLTELGDAVYRYLCSRFGHHHFIEDCVQDILIAIHEARHTYDPGRPFRPWLFAIVRHKAIDSLRRQQSRTRLQESQRVLALALDESAPMLEDSIAPGRLIDALSPQHREAITLTKIVGLSTAEAADRLSISESALKVRVHRAIRRLRRMLELEPV